MKVICFLFDPNVGGPTVRACNISKILRQDNYDVHFALPRAEGSAKAYLEDAGFEVSDLNIQKPVLPNKPMKFIRFLVGVPISIWRISRFLKQANPDVVHVNGAFDILPAVGAKWAGVPLVWQLNDMLFGLRLSRILGWFVGAIADQVAVTSKPVIDHYGVEKYNPIILPVPVDIARYTPRPAFGSGVVTFGFLGNWNPLKGQKDFIDTVQQLHVEGHSVSGRLYGKLLDSQIGYWTPLLQYIEEEGLGDIIHVEGFTSDVPKALQNVDILLVSSISEAGPLSCLEAIATGIPVVSYQVGDVDNMLSPTGSKPGGIVVDLGDQKALLEACRSLIVDHDLACQMGENARARAKDHYDLPHVAPHTAAAYNQAIRLSKQ